ncbi:HPP family protein [Ahrensia sp. 13_GOM-1096m]|uniref:HPP family protein n=1 Tax=Ahrensia sp. 13_GOM-1096m TaxID=1380380 RepID=UPI00047955EE|nr:HPP family protein [Ahrensia sp. 13_GOM-1096m]
MTFVSNMLRSLGPPIGLASPREALRAGFGALLGLALAGFFLSLLPIDLQLRLYLIAPFGASAVLLFAVPNSPLAQPWSAIVGNIIAALVGVAVCLSVPDLTLRIALAVGLTIVATSLFRAVHPPAGAVAMTAALNSDAVAELGFQFALTPVAAGTIFLVITATIYAKLTGRRYPFRQFDEPNNYGTQDPAPIERLGLSEDELVEILERYKQSFNLGVEDLARLVGAAEMQAATHRTGPLSADDIMSRNLVTVKPDTVLADIAALFRRHKFTALPVVDHDGHYLGVIFQIHLISRGTQDADNSTLRFSAAMARLLTKKSDRPVLAHEVMDVDGPRATPTTSIGKLLPLMAQGEVDAIPILEDNSIVGIVTQTDLIAAFARRSLPEKTHI